MKRHSDEFPTTLPERKVISFSQQKAGAMEAVYADKLYAFLTELMEAAQAQGDQEAVRRIDFARKHYLIPLTSEFLGESMVALRELLDTSGLLLTSEQASQAKEYVKAIKQQWFSQR